MRRRRSPRAARRPPRPLPRALCWLLQVVRLLVFAGALQLSGGSHVLVSAVGGAAAGCIDTCARSGEDESGEHGCPPGCPDCSCPHGRLPSLPPSLDPALPEQFAWERRDDWDPERPGAPPSPPSPSLYRPPRG